MAVKVKLQLKDKNPDDLKQFGNDIVDAMTGNANFATPVPTLTSVDTLVQNLETKINARTARESDLQVATQQMNAAADLLAAALTNLGTYVETTANNTGTAANPAAAIVESAGMDVAGSSTTPVGPMPKVTGLSGTAGDENGEVDLHWDPVRRGLAAYVIQMTNDPAALTGWTILPNSAPKKSKSSQQGLTSATRVWFRVAAQGTAGQGPFSDPVQVTVP
jgi:hypothetical protein